MTQRKLAATIFADIQGYSALMQKDEAVALLAQEKFQNHIHVTVPLNNGEVIQFYGDGCLMIFNSASEALHCAKALQDSFIQEDIPVRIGIHIGDVVMRSDNVFGDSVNLASRIESMGVPGSILFSSAIADNIRNKSGIEVKSLGFHRFKNIEKPIEVFALKGYSIPDLSRLEGKFREKGKGTSKKWLWGIAILAAISLIIWLSKDIIADQRRGDGVKSEIVVFPFQIKGNEEMAYLKHAVPEMLSTNLQNVGSISVVDPNSIIGVLGEDVEVKDPIDGVDLIQRFDAHNFILGNLTSVGNRINLSASLYDHKGKQLSVESVYSESFNELPNMIDELTRKIIINNFKAENSEILRTGAMMTDDLEALKYFFQGEKKRREYEIYEAIDLYQKAYEKDSSFYLALYRLVYLENAFFGVDGDYNNIEILKNNLASLPPKYQKLAEALFDHLGHNALGSISKYGYLINSYPEDLEVNLMMGEALFHHNNLIGKSQLESLPYFEKVYQYDSLNKEASSHLFFLYLLQEDLEALKKFKDKEFIYHKGMSAILDKDSSRYTQTIIQVSSSDVSGAGIIANNTLNDRLIDVLTFLQDVRQIKPLPLDQFPLFQDHVSRGHEKWVIENGNKLAGPFSAVFPATIAAHPDIPAYRNYLPRLSTQINGIEEMLDAFPFASSSNYAELKCMLAIAQNQKDTFNFYMQKVLDKGKRNDDYKGYSNFTRHYFDGIIAYRDGLFEEALAHFTALDNITLSLEDDQSEFFTRPLPRFLRGEILMKKGKYDEALGFFENFWLGPLSIVMVPWTYLRRAEIYAIQNRTKEAIEYYNKFISLYETSDPQYQSFVDNARKERDRLVAAMN